MNEERDLSLVEALDHLLARGVVIAGEAVISIGSVDLLYLGLNIVLANVDALTSGPEKRRRIESRTRES
ncbi:MAG TPA: gas vesicle protein [Thermoanaerobaculia bacterium]